MRCCGSTHCAEPHFLLYPIVSLDVFNHIFMLRVKNGIHFRDTGQNGTHGPILIHTCTEI